MHPSSNQTCRSEDNICRECHLQLWSNASTHHRQESFSEEDCSLSKGLHQSSRKHSGSYPNPRCYHLRLAATGTASCKRYCAGKSQDGLEGSKIVWSWRCWKCILFDFNLQDYQTFFRPMTFVHLKLKSNSFVNWSCTGKSKVRGDMNVPASAFTFVTHNLFQYIHIYMFFQWAKLLYIREQNWIFWKWECMIHPGLTHQLLPMEVEDELPGCWGPKPEVKQEMILGMNFRRWKLRSFV